jgi:hypothetical protein
MSYLSEAVGGIARATAKATLKKRREARENPCRRGAEEKKNGRGRSTKIQWEGALGTRLWGLQITRNHLRSGETTL